MNAVTADAARVSAITWQIAVEPSSTHCHQYLPPKRVEVSSEPTTGLGRTASAIGGAVASEQLSLLYQGEAGKSKDLIKLC
jgi:hypothetical protein